jgi:hypothetical protein
MGFPSTPRGTADILKNQPDSALKMKAGKELFVPDLLLSEYLDVVTRTEPVTDQEASALDSLSVLRLHRFREKIALRQKLVSRLSREVTRL